jgi:hypothetical protein
MKRKKIWSTKESRDEKKEKKKLCRPLKQGMY